MRILIISHYFPPLNSIASHRPYSWAKYWTEMGHQITVLTTRKYDERKNSLFLQNNGFEVIEKSPPFYRSIRKFLKKDDRNRETIQPETRVEMGYNTLTNPIKMVLSFLMSRGVSVTSRMPDLLDFWYVPAVSFARTRKWDLVVSTSGPYVTHLIARKLKKEGVAKKWIADFRDLWTENHNYKGIFPFTLLEKYLESKCLLEADVVTTVSQPLLDTISCGAIKNKFNVVENGFDSLAQGALVQELFFDDGKVRLVYTGAIYAGKQSSRPLLQAIRNLSKDRGGSFLSGLEVLFWGGQPGDLLEAISEADVSRWVKHKGNVTWEDALRIQRDAHVLLFIEFDDGVHEGVLTGKLFEYLNSGTEIWAIGKDQPSVAGDLILEARAGRFWGNDISQIEKALIQLIECRQKPVIDLDVSVVGKFERKKLAERMLALVDK